MEDYSMHIKQNSQKILVSWNFFWGKKRRCVWMIYHIHKIHGIKTSEQMWRFILKKYILHSKQGFNPWHHKLQWQLLWWPWLWLWLEMWQLPQTGLWLWLPGRREGRDTNMSATTHCIREDIGSLASIHILLHESHIWFHEWTCWIWFQPLGQPRLHGSIYSK